MAQFDDESFLLGFCTNTFGLIPDNVSGREGHLRFLALSFELYSPNYVIPLAVLLQFLLVEIE